MHPSGVGSCADFLRTLPSTEMKRIPQRSIDCQEGRFWQAGLTQASFKSLNRSLARLRGRRKLSRYKATTERLDVRELPASELERRLAWRGGFLAFSGRSLREVVGEINRYSPVRLETAPQS